MPMIAPPTADSLEPLDCRFLFGSEEANRVFRVALENDARAATLSPAFRAYYSLRALIPLQFRQALQRLRPVASSPRWCFPDCFMDSLAEQLGTRDAGFTTIHPWPDGARFAFVLTHDVETEIGLRNVARIADLEEELGFR